MVDQEQRFSTNTEETVGPASPRHGSRSAWRPTRKSGCSGSSFDSLREQTVTDWVCLISDDCSLPETFREIEAEIEGDDRFPDSPGPRRAGLTAIRAGARHGPRDSRTGKLRSAAIRMTAGTRRARWLEQALGGKGAGKAGRPARSSPPATRGWSPRTARVIAETTGLAGATTTPTSASMLIANTVTGAASLFTREITNTPCLFPEALGEQFHDHRSWPSGRDVHRRHRLRGQAALRLRPARLGRARHDAANAGIKVGWRPKHLSIGAVRQFSPAGVRLLQRVYLRLSVLAR